MFYEKQLFWLMGIVQDIPKLQNFNSFANNMNLSFETVASHKYIVLFL